VNHRKQSIHVRCWPKKRKKLDPKNGGSKKELNKGSKEGGGIPGVEVELQNGVWKKLTRRTLKGKAQSSLGFLKAGDGLGGENNVSVARGRPKTG